MKGNKSKPFHLRKPPAKRKMRLPEIVSGNNTPVDRLTSRKRAFLNARVNGHTVKDAAAVAGVSARRGNDIEHSPDVKEAYLWMMRKMFPMKEMVKLIKDGAHATQPVFTPEGMLFGERPDWRARHPYIKMAVEQAGYATPPETSTPLSFVNITVKHLGGHAEKKADKAGTAATQPEHIIAAEANSVT